MINIEQIRLSLKQLGLSSQETILYLTLLTHNSLSPLVLGKKTGLNRSSIYRYLENLESLGLVKRTLKGKSTLWSPEPPDHLELMVESKLAKLESLKATLPPLIKSLSALATSSPTPTRIHHYQGVEGIKQMLWNTLKAKTQFAGFGYMDWNYLVGKPFAEKLRQEVIAKRIISREILNQVDDSYQYTDAKEAYTKYYQHRAISKKVLKITHDTYIYNNVYAVLQKYQGEVFGVEIINQEIADSQRQIFEILWQIAK